MKLEDLVPPLELCKQIPEGEFADSAFIYTETGLHMREIQGLVNGEWITLTFAGIPAPTLAEIMAALNDCGNVFLRKDDDGWMIMRELPGDDEGYGYEVTTERDHDNPTTAALKLWLEVTK